MDKRRYFKFVAGFLGLIVLVFGSYFAWRLYQFNQMKNDVRELAEGLKQIEREARDRAMADTYGGKTPQETLRMYIEAVEKGDYELASKYFVEEKREKEISRLNSAPTENIKSFISKVALAATDDGEYSFDNKEFLIYKPLYIRTILFPNGTWKIAEI